jgi:hypothetical protein
MPAFHLSSRSQGQRIGDKLIDRPARSKGVLFLIVFTAAAG